MKTVGEILQKTRKEKGLTLESISAETRIGLKYLVAIEANDFNHLPPAAFTKGFLQSYAKTIGVDPATVLAVFRRDYDQDERGRIIPRGLTEPMNVKINWLTPQTVTISVSISVAIVIIGFFIRQVIQFNTAPTIVLAEPPENATILSPVTVRGKTNSEASLTINNEPVSLDPDGNFTKDIPLPQGEHTLVVIATNRSGKSRSLQRLITILPPLPVAPTP